MLINFAVKNFRSFKESTSLSMVAGGFKRFPSHTAEVAGLNVLKSAFVFGANASGKSNLINAVAFLQAIVEGGVSRVSLDKNYFRITRKIDDIGVFQIDYSECGEIYSYGLAVSYSRAEIVGEWLALRGEGNKEIAVFTRETSDDGKIVIKTDMQLQGKDELRFEVYCDDFANGGMQKMTFLADIARRAGEEVNDGMFFHIKQAREWFYRLIVIFPSSSYGGMIRYIKDTDMRISLSELLHHFDTGIERLVPIDIEADKVLSTLNPQEREKTKASLIRRLTDGRHIGGMKYDFNDSTYLVNYKNGELTMKKLMANHGNRDELFEREDESDGTQRLYDLLPLNRIFADDCVVLIDELDRSLHTQATLEFIKLFGKASAGHLSQLIATTHDHDVMSMERLRQDEIWFVERNDDHSSHVYSLSQFKARFDKDVEKDYMLGKYGAVPLFRMIGTAGGAHD